MLIYPTYIPKKNIYFILFFVSFCLSVVFSGAVQAKMFKLPQTLVLKHEEHVKPYKKQTGSIGLSGIMSDVAESVAAGHPVGWVAKQGSSGEHPPCLVAKEGEQGAGKLVAKLISSVGVTGVRKRDADLQFRFGFKKKPHILYEEKNAPEACETDLKKRAEAELARIIKDLDTPTTVTAAEIFKHIPLGGEDGEFKPLTLKKKVKFFGDEIELKFVIPLGRIL
ncbi:MAG: hypothetical protein COA45_12315 [Zetaproteobacteria bacterium]|nr:MAG: hypothetical protein COA45_12315 [Zetaproteobacteria bacterium]